MKLSSTWRRHPLAGYAVLFMALAVFGVGYAAVSAAIKPAHAAASQTPEHVLAKGRQLFNASCASCHGMQGQGTQRAPSLVGAGAAAVHFQMSTGRMPLSNPEGAQGAAKDTTFAKEQIRAIAAYVATFGPGPAIPTDEQVDPEGGDLMLGGKLFRANCASCHNFAGEGGALTYGKEAPQITDATPRQIYEAMLTGPGAMPPFDNSMTPEQKSAIVHYVRATAEEPNMGGAGLGRKGPVPEGLVAWLVGAGAIVACAMWITARKHG